MKKIIVNFLLGLVVVLGLITPLAQTVSAYDISGAKSAACAGIGDTTGGSCSADSGSTFDSIISTVINVFSIIVGIVAVIMLIVSGFKFITSGGESNSVASAKKGIIYAIIGLVVVALAQFIVHFVLNTASVSTTPPAKTSQPAPKPKPKP